MLQLINKTKFAPAMTVYPDQHGIDCAIAVVKATFDIKPEIAVSKEQAPVIKSDEYWGKPFETSLKYAFELTLEKPGSDIVMIGSGYAPESKPARSINVKFTVGKQSKEVIVFGDRFWKKAGPFLSITKPEPFIKMPLIYEKAFGGSDAPRDDKEKLVYEKRNPIGSGFTIKKGITKTKGLKLPNIEDPESLIKSIKDKPNPAGFGYIAPWWKPRCDFKGTYDKKWEKERAPYLPKDFDLQFFNSAHPDLITEGYLKGGEDVIIENASESGLINFQLPKLDFEIVFNIDGGNISHKAIMDTLIIEPDQNRFSMVWRACERCDKKMQKIKRVDIKQK